MWSTSSVSNIFCYLLFKLNFTQLTDQPTHIHGNILDMIIIYNDKLIYNVIIHPCDYQPIPSDHHIISFQLTLSDNVTFKTLPQFIFNCCKADYNGLNDFLLNSDYSVCEHFSDVESV